MDSSGLSLESSSLSESSLVDTSVADLNIEESVEVSKEAAEEGEVIQYITYTVSEPMDYDTVGMVNVCCCGILIGCGAALFAFLVRLSIYSVMTTFRAFSGAGKEE